MPEILEILSNHLPQWLFKKITRFTHNFSSCSRQISITWRPFHKHLNSADTESCSQQLMRLLQSINPTENHVHTFHIQKNHQIHRSEPTSKNTSTMIFKFLKFIYKRNIIASIVKFIILKPLLKSFINYNSDKKFTGTLYAIQKRLQEIVFESVLVSFNGANYDNYLLCNHLIILMTQQKQKIKIFKKGSSISTIVLLCKRNLHLKRDSLTRHKLHKKRHIWPMNLYIKDIRNLVSANMSLDKLGKLFNLNVSKLCFPYEKAISIRALKSIHSLHPNDDSFWKDTFANRNISLETRLHAQKIYEQKNFQNLYEYGNYY